MDTPTPQQRVQRLPDDLDTDLAVASAMQNAHDLGLREDADDDGEAFWTAVLGQLEG